MSLVLPFYAYLFFTLLLGVVLGGTAMWLSQARWRRNARHHGRAAARWHAEADRLTRERDATAATRPSGWRRPAAKQRIAPSAPAGAHIRGPAPYIQYVSSVRLDAARAMTTEVKICGLRTQGALDAALAGGADYVGFVFYARSPRNIAPADARLLAARARGKAKIVALLVDPDDALLEEVIETVAPDIVQLHGSETPARVAEIAQRFRPCRHEGGERRGRRRYTGGAGLRGQG